MGDRVKERSPAQRVVGVKNTGDMLYKLSWEIRQLGVALTTSKECPLAAQGATFHAFNCAVTAWHVVDWAWSESKGDIRKKLSPGNQKDWIENITKESHELAACQALANNGKHAIGRYGADLLVREIQDLEAVYKADGQLEGFTGSFEIKIRYAGKDYESVTLFNGAGAYLQTVLVSAGLLDGLWRHGYVFDSLARHDL